MNYDFAGDTAKLEGIRDDLKDNACKVEEKVIDIYEKIQKMHDVWSGAAYESFKDYCNRYKDSMYYMVLLIKRFAVEIDKIITSFEAIVVNYDGK